MEETANAIVFNTRFIKNAHAHFDLLLSKQKTRTHTKFSSCSKNLVGEKDVLKNSPAIHAKFCYLSMQNIKNTFRLLQTQKKNGGGRV